MESTNPFGELGPLLGSLHLTKGNTIGVLFVSFMISVFLFGFLTFQVQRYYIKFEKDRQSLKILVRRYLSCFACSYKSFPRLASYGSKLTDFHWLLWLTQLDRFTDFGQTMFQLHALYEMLIDNFGNILSIFNPPWTLNSGMVWAATVYALVHVRFLHCGLSSCAYRLTRLSSPTESKFFQILISSQ